MIDGLNGVEPRHLATLTALAESGSFKAAAARLGYAQSAVSQQVAQLERILGVAVVQRAPGQPMLALTDAGSIVVRHARGILGQLDAAVADLRGAQRGAPVLSVGADGDLVRRLIPRALTLLRRQAPETRFAIHDDPATPSARARDVRRGVLDLALDDLPLEDGPFEAVEIARDPIVLLARRDAAVTRRAAPIGLHELATIPLVVDATWRSSPIEAQLRASGVPPRIAVHAVRAGSVEELVTAGAGAALVPRSSAERADASLVALDLDELLPPRRIGLYWHAQRRRLASIEQFRDALVAVADDLTPAGSTVGTG